jgi:hypothetical protein
MIRLLASLSLMVSTYAFQQDLAKLPNGNTYGITLGHPGGATKKATPFASSFYSAGQKWSKTFCQADTDGDGQSNGLEMGDPCCLWSVGKSPMITTTLSDPNSAASKTTRQMPTCMQTNSYTFAFQNAMLQCQVCTQALQLEMNKPSDNAADFILLSVKSCKGATQDDQQQLLCIKTMVKNAEQLFKDQKNALSPTQSCMNLGLTCMMPIPTTQAPIPTTQAPLPTTQAPLPTTQAPIPTTQAPLPTTQAPLPTTQAPLPTPPLPPVIKYEMAKIPTPVEASPVESTNSGTYMTIGVTVISTLFTVGIVWGISHVCKRSKKEPLLDMDDSFSPLPDIEYKA